jgi:hypothetical protein
LKNLGACILPPGEGFSVAVQKTEVGSMCAFKDMWPILKSLVEDT